MEDEFEELEEFDFSFGENDQQNADELHKQTMQHRAESHKQHIRHKEEAHKHNLSLAKAKGYGYHGGIIYAPSIASVPDVEPDADDPPSGGGTP